MKIKAGMTLIVLLLLLPIKGYCELEGHALLDESINGIRLYQRPKVKIPVGWQEEEKAGQESQCLVIVPKQNSQDPKTLIYAMAIQKDKPKQVLQSFIKEDIANFKANNKKGIVKKAAAFQTAKGPLPTYSFSYPYKGKHFIQTVVYAEERDYFLTFTLTGKSPTAHKAGEAVFSSMLSSYR